jgi:hypothetical protein
MPYVLPRTLLACGLCLASMLGATTTKAQKTNLFDGDWHVTLACPRAADGALPFTFHFAATVTMSVMHGENGTAGHPGWMVLEGKILPNGDAALEAHGLTGQSAYNINQTERGVPYRHPVTAHFEAMRGAGQWNANRICDFTFTRQ